MRDKCKRCSHGSKSIYHVGDCPKGPIIEWIPMSNPNAFSISEEMARIQERIFEDRIKKGAI